MLGSKHFTILLHSNVYPLTFPVIPLIAASSTPACLFAALLTTITLVFPAWDKLLIASIILAFHTYKYDTNKQNTPENRFRGCFADMNTELPRKAIT
jgi:hypothetical protein